jgi:hypothetical protein
MLRGLISMGLVWMAMGASAQDTLVGMGKINGYTGDVFDTRGERYDLLVDGSLKADDPGARKFRTVEAAYAAASAGTPDKPTVIGIMPNVYLLPGKGTQTGLSITKNDITLLGLTDDRRKVVLADNRGNQEGAGVKGASNNGFTMMVEADGFSAINLSIVNYCNMDYDYPGDASKSLKKRSDVITQAVAAQFIGDRLYVSHVAFLSRLDTMFVRSKRSYFTNAYVEGTDDFIGGGDDGIWKDSEVLYAAGNGVSFSTGIVFLNTVFKATKGLEFYKIDRLPIALIDSTLPAPRPDAPLAWMAWKAQERTNYYSLTYRSKDTNGKPVSLIDSIVGTPRRTMGRELSAEEARAFNPWNLLHSSPDGKVDGWDPAHVRAKYEGEKSQVFRMALTNANSSIRTGDKGVVIGGSVLPVDAKDKTIRWSTESKLVTLSAKEGDSVTVTGANTTNRAEYVPVKAAAANGFYATAWVYVEPKYVDPPKFTEKPVLDAPALGKVSVKYALALDGREDQSVVSWYLCANVTCASERKVAVSRGNVPLKSYELGEGAVGKFVKVTVAPKHNISEPGEAVSAMAARTIEAKDVVTTTVSPKFRNFVEAENTGFENDFWTVKGTWTVEAGENFVDGYGLRVGLAGASLFYVNDGPVGDMTLKVVMDPEKVQGQGFGVPGSAGDEEKNQRADIFIKYDPRTKTGYSLRFWRTNLSAEKCMFQLYKIVNGKGSPVSDAQQLTGVFKPQTTITLSIIGDKFTVKGSNTVDHETLSLEGTVEPNLWGGAGAFWSGTTPRGNSVVFSEFRMTYPR